jgi:hypothetical protein
MYTLAIDLVSQGLKRDEEGRAKPSDLFKLNVSGDGEISKVRCNQGEACDSSSLKGRFLSVAVE